MRTLQEIYYEKIKSGIKSRAIIKGLKMGGDTFYPILFGSKLPNRKDYGRIYDYFQEDFMIGKPNWKEIEDNKAKQFAMTFLNRFEKTVLPRRYLGREEELIQYLATMGVDARWYKREYVNGEEVEETTYLERK